MTTSTTVNPYTGALQLVTATLSLTTEVTGTLQAANIGAGSIAYAKLSLSNSILNADINSAAAIAYSKLNLTTSIVNADISTSAAIAFSKLATLASAHILVGSVSNVATDVAVTGDISLTNAGVTAYSGTVPLNKGGTGQVTKAAAFDALSPMSSGGEIIYGGTAGTGTKLAAGAAGTVLTSAGTAAPTWSLSAGAIYVYGAGNGGNSITADVTNITFTEVQDTQGAWNGTEFTAPRADVYTFAVNTKWTTSAARIISLYKNTGGGYALFCMIAKTASDDEGTSGVKSLLLAAGDKVAVRSSSGTTLSNSTSAHTISIISEGCNS